MASCKRQTDQNKAKNLLLTNQLCHPFYSHFTGEPALASSACMPLQMATSTLGLERRRWSSPQQCYLHCLCTLKNILTVCTQIGC